MIIFLDLDNTLFPSKFAYEFAIEKLDFFFEEKYKTNLFKKIYEEKRAETKKQLENHTSNRLRILYFKKLFEDLKGSLKVNETLELEQVYFKFFIEGAVKFYKHNNLNYTKLISNLNKLGKENSVAILTNENLRTQLIKLNIFSSKLKIPFQLFCSEEIGFEKPSEKFFKYALKKMKSNPKKTIMVGDSLKDDVQGAINLGINSIHILSMFGDENYFEKKSLNKKKYIESKNINKVILEIILQKEKILKLF